MAKEEEEEKRVPGSNLLAIYRLTCIAGALSPCCLWNSIVRLLNSEGRRPASLNISNEKKKRWQPLIFFQRNVFIFFSLSLSRAAKWSCPYLIEFDSNLIDRAAVATVTNRKKKTRPIKTKRDQLSQVYSVSLFRERISVRLVSRKWPDTRSPSGLSNDQKINKFPPQI